MKKVLLVKAGGFSARAKEPDDGPDDKPLPFGDYTLVVNGVKLNFDVEELTFQAIKGAMGKVKAAGGLKMDSETVIRRLEITIDPGEEAYLISNKVPYEIDSKET